MASFSPSEAAFTGFRVVREHPKAVIFWAVLQFCLSLASVSLLVGLAGPTLASFQAGTLTPTTDPTVAMAMMQKAAPAYAGLLLLSLLIYPVVYAAMNRAVLRPGEDRFGYLRLGADELRQLGLLLLYVAVAIGAYIAVVLVMLVIALIGGLLIGLLGKGAAPVVGGLIAVLMFIGLLCGAAYAAVRLSLASALTFATGRVNLFGSWALTRGQFWPMFGVLMLSAAISVVVAVLGMVVIGVAMVLVSGGVGGFAGMMHPDMSSLAAYLTPRQLIYFALVSILYALMTPLMLTPPAAIYQSLAHQRGLPGAAQGPVEDVFA